MMGTAQERHCPPCACRKASVMSTIYLLSPNRSGLPNSSVANCFPDANDFSDREPGSLTKRRYREQAEIFVMNTFDAVVYLGLVIAMVTGFRTGLVRSAFTILGYMVAVPIAIGAMSALSQPTNGRFVAEFAQNGLVFFGVFLFAGMALGALLRAAIDDATGSEAGIVDRLCGAALGAARVGLIAITIVLVLDQFTPIGAQPQWLAGSKLRPWLLAAGQRGFSSLPPDIAAVIDRLKRVRQI